MLLLNASPSITVDGLDVYPDHADPNQFWVFPGPVRLARRPGDDRAQFSFIYYKPAAVSAGVKGGGFVSFEVDLHLEPKLEQRILGRLASIVPAGGNPRIAIVPFDEGTVQCVALNLQGSGGTVAGDAPPDTFNAVEKILGASIPSLRGDNNAVFSLTLSQEGAIILKQALSEAATPIGVIYNLKYTGLRPALDVEITADYKRVYESFSASLEGQYYWFKAGVDLAFEKLRQDGAIKIKVINFTGASDQDQKEKWAFDFFKENLFSQWFTPTLVPGKVSGSSDGGGGSSIPGLPNIPGTGGNKPATGTNSGNNQTNPSGNTGTTTNPSGGGNTPSGANSGTPATNPTSPASPSGAPSGVRSATVAAAAPAQQVTYQPATLHINSTTPSPAPSGYSLTHNPATSGTQERITVAPLTMSEDPNWKPTVQVDNVVQPLDSQGQFTVDVANGASRSIVVSYPPTQDQTESYNLLFDFEKPRPTSQTFTTTPVYASYLTNTPMGDARFPQSPAPANSGVSTMGANGLKDWIQNRLASPAEVGIIAHASYEGDLSKDQYNMDLSERRELIAKGIIGNLANITNSQHVGQRMSMLLQNTGPNSAPEDFRVAIVTGKVSNGSPQTQIQATLSRPAQPGGNQPPGGGNQPPGGGNQPPGGGNQPPGGQKPADGGNKPEGTAGSPAVSLKLKYIHQDELKTVTFSYSRQEAVQRTYAPQGLFGLMLTDLDKTGYFTEVDLDDIFFREFQVQVEAPIDFAQIGLTSAFVALDYGATNDPINNKHGDMVFDPTTVQRQTFAVYVNKNHDTTYQDKITYNFNPNSGWEGEKITYELPVEVTEARRLSINPYQRMAFLEVAVQPGDVDWFFINEVEATLSYTSPTGWVSEKMFVFSQQNQAPQNWRLRLGDLDAPREYQFSYVFRLKDGSQQKSEPESTRATRLVIDDLFPGKLRVDFIPLYDVQITRMVYIDFEYVDPDNHYERIERMELNGNAQDPVSLNISLMNPALKSFRYRLTFVGVDNSLHRSEFFETTETLIAVSQ